VWGQKVVSSRAKLAQEKERERERDREKEREKEGEREREKKQKKKKKKKKRDRFRLSAWGKDRPPNPMEAQNAGSQDVKGKQRKRKEECKIKKREEGTFRSHRATQKKKVQNHKRRMGRKKSGIDGTCLGPCFTPEATHPILWGAPRKWAENGCVHDGWRKVLEVQEKLTSRVAA